MSEAEEYIGRFEYVVDLDVPWSEPLTTFRQEVWGSIRVHQSDEMGMHEWTRAFLWTDFWTRVEKRLQKQLTGKRGPRFERWGNVHGDKPGGREDGSLFSGVPEAVPVPGRVQITIEIPYTDRDDSDTWPCAATLHLVLDRRSGDVLDSFIPNEWEV